VKTKALDWRRIAAATQAKVIYHPETGSTNDDARRLAEDGAEEGTMVIADSQSAGRGRRGAAWVSPPQRNLLCSVVLRPWTIFDYWPVLTHACALAVCEALEEVPDLPPPQIKWPNDVYLNGRKVCGILMESVIQARDGFVVAGVGVNLNLRAEEFPEDLRATATSVWLERGGQEVSREDIAISFHRRLMLHGGGFAWDIPDALLRGCERRSFLTGKQVTLLSGGREHAGLVTGLGPCGELRLQRAEDGREELIASADFVRPMPLPDGAR